MQKEKPVRRYRPSERRKAERVEELEKLRRLIANFTPIEYAEGESWTDDQAEDAITTVNQLIGITRKIGAQP